MKFLNFYASAFALALFSAEIFASNFNPEIGVILDGAYKQGETALSGAEEGFSLGHTELTLSSPIDDLFYGRFTAVLESHDGNTEVGLEEAYLQTTGLPSNLSIRAGRFLSQVGYLNGRHTHSDAFSERPAVYRALLGSHYFDDGVQMNMLMPTPFYWRAGLEVLNGTQLSGSNHDETAGVYTLSTKFGDDIGTSQSWQAGFSYLYNRLTDIDISEEHEEDHGHESGHDGHNHSANYMGKNLYIADVVWKWSPNGNAREEQVALSAEYLYADKLNRFAASNDYHKGWYVSAVQRLSSVWSVGARYGRADLKDAHGDHFHDQQIEESNLSLSWSHSHFSTVRLMYTHQTTDGFSASGNAMTLQYVVSLGAHGAHDF